jgi:pimeloyl-[acyl-carrier protein] synthase
MSDPAGPPEDFDTEAALLGALFSPAGRADPHVILRAAALPGCQYQFVRDLLRDPRFGAPSLPPSAEPAFLLLARWMMRLDGDRHRRLREAFGGLFTARRVERYRAIIAEQAAALIGQPATSGGMDVVAGFARPLPFTVIADVVGVPGGDRDWLADAIATLNRGFGRQRDTDHTAVAAANDAAREMVSYFAVLLDQRAAQPADDLMSLLAARHAGGADRQDLLANCVFFINAGHQTTATLLTLGTHLLCTRPQVLAALLEDPGLWPAAVEEMLRLVCPVTLTGATARTDAIMHGTPMAAGEQRLLFLAAANRDPAIFPDPDRFDLSRDPNPHLSFSAGAHFCLGAPLARLHGQVALRTLFTRYPSLTITTPPVITASVPIRQVDQFFVQWQPDGNRFQVPG